MTFSFARQLAFVSLALVLSAFTPATFAQQTAVTIFSFGGGTQGTTPSTPLVEASDGKFYGGTSDGGTESSDDTYNGTIFSVSPGGAYTSIHQFNGSDGSDPSFLMLASDGNLYGTTNAGGLSGSYGTVFQLTPSGMLTTIHNFTGGSDGSQPNFLIEGSDGNLYGTAYQGTQNYGGTLFEISRSGVFTVLGAFPFSLGYPLGIVQATNGNFYGALTGTTGGDYPSGVFEYVPGKAPTTLVTFNPGSSEETPVGQFAEGSDGNLYGTLTGGQFGPGGIFKMTPAGAVSFLYDFTGTTYGYSFSGLFPGSDGKFYGDMSGSSIPGYGSVYSIDSSGDFTEVGLLGYGQIPAQARLLQASDGNFYGVVTPGSVYDSTGGIYRVTPAAAAPPISISISPTQISAGDSATLTWSVSNATSDSFQRCFGSGAWSGIKSASGSLTVKPSADGTYNYALTCGGTETSVARLLVGNGAAASSTAMVATSNLVKPGGSTTLLVNVNSANGSGATPTGPVTLLENSTPLFTANLANGSASFTVNGSELPVGQTSFKAEYAGDSNYAGSTSAAVVVTFQAQPSLKITTPAYVTKGQPINYSVDVSGPTGSAVPTGTVTVSDGYSSQTLPLANGTVNGTFSTANISDGYVEISGTYNGSSVYLTASNSGEVQVLTPSTVVLSSSATQVAAGQSVTLVAQVTGSSSYSTPTGMVSFEVDGVVLGSSAVSTSGVALLTASSKGISPGTYPVVAIYNGDVNNGIGTSAAVNITVRDGTTTTLTVSPDPVSIGSKAMLSATVTRASTSGTPGGSVTFSTGSRVLATVSLSNGQATYAVTVGGIPTGTYPVVATYNGDGSDATSVSTVVDVTVN